MTTDSDAPDRKTLDRVTAWSTSRLASWKDPRIAEAFQQLMQFIAGHRNEKSCAAAKSDQDASRSSETLDRILRTLSEAIAQTAAAQPPQQTRSVCRLFCYGTLKRGFSRSYVLKGQRFLGEGRTLPGYRMFNCGTYPGIAESKHGIALSGEVWEVDGPCLEELDRIEGVDLNLYRRSRIQLQPPFEHLPVEAYFYNLEHSQFPDCGSVWDLH